MTVFCMIMVSAMKELTKQSLKGVLKPYQINTHFIYLWKKSENQMFSTVSRGYRRRILVWNGLREAALKIYNAHLTVNDLCKTRFSYNFKFDNSYSEHIWQMVLINWQLFTLFTAFFLAHRVSKYIFEKFLITSA